jgi:protein involved in polysaccharide export with SLBB domain
MAPSSRCLLLTLTLALLGGPVTAYAQSTVVVAGTARAVVLSAGDVLRVTVWRKPELSGELVVAADGSLAHPLYRSVQVAGMALPEAEAKLRTFLRTYEAEPQIWLEPLLRVMVGGEVRQPNVYLLSPATTLAQAVAMAGGPTAEARVDKLRVLRTSGEVRLDLTDPASEAFRQPVRSGDQVWLPRRRSVFREYIVPGSSVVAAIALIARIAVEAGK